MLANDSFKIMNVRREETVIYSTFHTSDLNRDLYAISVCHLVNAFCTFCPLAPHIPTPPTEGHFLQRLLSRLESQYIQYEVNQ